MRDCLEKLYSEFGILPAPVLLILAETKKLLLTRPQPLNRNMRQRRKDIKVLDAASKVIRAYELEAHFALDKFETLKKALGTKMPTKPSDIELRFCAQTLEAFFRRVIGQPLHECIGSLLVNVFGWRGAKGDLRLAALQRTKGRSIRAKEIILLVAIDFQKRRHLWGERLARVKVGLRIPLKAAVGGRQVRTLMRLYNRSATEIPREVDR